MNVSNAYDDAIISYSAYFRVVFSFIYSFIHSFTLFGSGSCVGGDWDTAIDHFKSIITHLYNLDYWYFNYSMPHYTHRTNSGHPNLNSYRTFCVGNFKGGYTVVDHPIHNMRYSFTLITRL